MPSFNDFLLQPSTHAVLANMKIAEPTPIQAEAIPALLTGKDLVGQSATGSGKTLAYSIPLVQRLARDKREVQALVLIPTRELAVQVNAVLGKLAASRRLTTALLVGGRPYGSQISALRYGAQIVVGTPGRVKDHLERGSLVLSKLRICVLDEADQMLDSGFAPIIEDILSTTPDTRQMALFSATMPEWVKKLQEKFLTDPVKVEITAATSGPSTIEQIAYQVPQAQKIAALCTLLNATEGESSLIFGKTKYGVEKLGKQLSKLGFTVGTLHGNKSQRAREEVLTAFRHGQVQTLLATNVAARGLDIQGITQVINYELPESNELFTHRIGRTGRMGKQGKAITLLVPADLPKWRRMARDLGQTATIQRLAIDEETINTVQAAKAEAAVTQEQERQPYSEQSPTRYNKQERQPYSEQPPIRRHKQERDPYSEQPTVRRNKQERDPYSEQPTVRRHKQERDPYSEQPTVRRNKQERDPYSEQPTVRYNKQVSVDREREQEYSRSERPQRDNRFSRSTGKPKTRTFAASEPQYRTARKKFGTAPARRANNSKRAASR